MLDLANRHEQTPEKDAASNNDAPSQDSATEALLEKANDLFSKLIKISRDRLEEKKECSTQLVAAIYGLHEALFARKRAYAAFLEKRGIEPGKSTNEFADITRAVMEQRGSGVKPPSITLYAQACHVLKRQSIAPEEAVQWLNEPDKSGGNRGKGRTGFGKTKLLWSESPEGQAEREKKRKTKEQSAKEYLDGQFQKAAGDSSGEGKSAEAAPPPGSAGIALIECSETGEWIVKQVLTDDVVKTAQTVQTYRPKNRPSQKTAA